MDDSKVSLIESSAHFTILESKIVGVLNDSFVEAG